MEQNPDISANSDHDIWRQELLRRRRSERFQGWILLSIGGIGLLALLFTLATSFPRLLTLGPLFDVLSLLVVLAFFSSFLLGISTLQSASKAPAEHDIARVRQMERTRLFQEAQGKLPWSYRRTGGIGFAILGCIALIGGVLVLLSFVVRSSDGWVMESAGLVFVWLALYVIPRERRRLPEQSTRTLAREMIVGETTRGTPLEE